MSDTEKLAGTWRLVTIRDDGKVHPDRGADPTGFITYHPSGWMHVVIQPDRPPIAVAGERPTGEQALASLVGYTAYFGTFTVDEKAKVVTHHRTGSVQPGWQRETDFFRAYRFITPDKIVLGSIGSKRELIWERLK